MIWVKGVIGVRGDNVVRGGTSATSANYGDNRPSADSGSLLGGAGGGRRILHTSANHGDCCPGALFRGTLAPSNHNNGVSW